MAKLKSSSERIQAKRQGEESLADKLLAQPWMSVIFALPPWFIINHLLFEVVPAPAPTVSFLQVLGLLLSVGMIGFLFFTSKKKEPWPWIFLAMNPLFICNGIHTIDFYIKAIWIASVFVLTFIFVKKPRDGDTEPGLAFNTVELLFLGYIFLGTLALLWSKQPLLGYERLVYLMYGAAGYVVGKQTRFWESTLFWNVFSAVALLVGVGGVFMWFGYEKWGFMGFDWIMSAGRPSSTLSYRAYAGTYMVVTLPFLFWYMFSNHIKSKSQFVLAASSFVFTFLFLIATRARSGWLGWAVAIVVMAFMYVYSQSGSEEFRKSRGYIFASIGTAILAGIVTILAYQVPLLQENAFIYLIVAIGIGSGFGYLCKYIREHYFEKTTNLSPLHRFAYLLPAVFVATLAIGMLPPSSSLLDKDTNPQKLQGTGKETMGAAVSTISRSFSGSDRFDFWTTSRRILFEKHMFGEYSGAAGLPGIVTGIGIGHYPIYVPLYSDILHSLGAEIHNDWVQAMVELGIVGFILYTLLPIVLFYYTWKNRHRGIMIACAGGIFAWVFSTQTDFLIPRIYGLLWVGGFASIIVGIEKPKPVFRLRALTLPLTVRYAAAAYFVYMAFSYWVTMICDREIYRTLVYTNVPELEHRGMPVDSLTKTIFPSDKFPSYRYGIGKYLIFSPITDLAKAIQRSEMNEANTPILARVQKELAYEVLWMHPLNYNAMAIITDMAFKQSQVQRTPQNAQFFDKTPQEYLKESMEQNKKYLALRPNDGNMWLFKAQTALALGDSIVAGEAVYKALATAPGLPLGEQFWFYRLSDATRKYVRENFGFATKATPDSDSTKKNATGAITEPINKQEARNKKSLSSL